MALPQIGDLFADRYEIQAVLGEGGFGIVYGAVTHGTGRPVALKLLKPSEGGYQTSHVARFLRELRTVGRLESPHTVTLYDCGRTDDGLLYMVCELVEGRDLSDVLEERGTLTEAETEHVLVQILRSLAEAHELGVLHRDIKPSNIRVFAWDGDPLSIKVLDFGLARSYVDEAARLTGTGLAIGTPRYMAPEQMADEKLTPGTDLFSLGVVAYEMLHGRASTSGRPAWSRRLRVAEGRFSPRLTDVVNRLVEVDASER